MKTKNLWKKLMPYIIMLFVSFAACYIIAWPGLNYGSDINFHIANIIDDYKSIKSGYFSPISHYLANGIGYGKRLFYSPLSHLSVALMLLLIEKIGLNLIHAYKIVIFLSIFISGIFTYKFLQSLTKQNYVGSLIGACIYILSPYRIFDFFCRAAFAEGLAFCFIPLFFKGLYDITHFDKKINLITFSEIIIGGSVTYLTHNITGFYTFVFGIIYLLFNIKGVIHGFKIKNYLPVALISMALLIGISSIAMFSQLELLNMDYYLVSKPSHMWTGIDNIRDRLHETGTYSGIINMPFLYGAYKVPYLDSIMKIIYYMLYMPFCLVLDMFLKKVKALKYFHNAITFILAFVFTCLLNYNMEAFLSLIFVYASYMFISLMVKDSDEPYKIKWYKEPMFYYAPLMVGLCFFMMESDLIWNILPSFFYNIQFPWRLWTFVCLFTSLFIGFLFSYINKRKVAQIVGVCLLGFVLMCSETNIEKKLKYENDQSQWIFEIDEEYYFNSGISIGFNKEYAPAIFYDPYKPYNSNSYWNNFRYRIRYNFNQEDNYSFKPKAIEKEAKISNVKVDTPNYQFDVDVVFKDTIIQIPLIYYPGYETTIYNFTTQSMVDYDLYNLDGVLALNLDSGNYRIDIRYKGTTLRQISYYLCPISSLISLSFIGFELIRRKKREVKK